MCHLLPLIILNLNQSCIYFLDNNPSYHGNSYRYSGQTINFLTSLYTAGKNSTISTAIPPTNTLITTTGSTSSEVKKLHTFLAK